MSGDVVQRRISAPRGLLAVHLRHGAVHHHEIEMAEPKFLERFAST